LAEIIAERVYVASHAAETYLGGAPLGRPMAEERPVVLYPAYFDLRRSRQEGRRVPKGLAVEAPTVEEVEKAAKALGLQPKVEADKAFPGSHWKHDGRVLVRADYFKTSVVRKVAEKMKAARSG